MELVPGVHRVDGIGPVANVFLVSQPDGAVLIDAGTRFAAGGILRYLEQQGYAPEAVKAILVTHGDLDHIGGLHAVKEKTGAEVICHRLEAPIVEGREQRKPARGGLAQRVMAFFTRALMPVKPTKVDRPVEGGETVFGFRVVHTPGHSPGSASYLLPEKRVLFVGDAMGNFGNSLSLPFRAYTTDMERANRSVKSIAELDFDVCCFGHGPSIVGGAQAAVREFASKL